MKGNCGNCLHARKSGNVDWVGCAHYIDELSRSGLSEEKFVGKVYDNEIFAPNDFATGWVWLMMFPDESSTNVWEKGTATEGLMTNGMLCVKKIDHCRNYVSRKTQ